MSPTSRFLLVVLKEYASREGVYGTRGMGRQAGAQGTISAAKLEQEPSHLCPARGASHLDCLRAESQEKAPGSAAVEPVRQVHAAPKLISSCEKKKKKNVGESPGHDEAGGAEAFSMPPTVWQGLRRSAGNGQEGDRNRQKKQTGVRRTPRLVGVMETSMTLLCKQCTGSAITSEK